MAAKVDENTAVEFIRNEIRGEINFNRKQQRYDKVNRNRFALGVASDITNDVYTVEFVSTITKNLRKKSLNINEYRQLQNALIQSDDHINAFFQIGNAIHGLSRDLSGSSVQSKLAAANCCCNLALGNAKACTTIAKFVGPYLIAELESDSTPLAEVCAWTIGNLVIGSEKAFSFLHAQGSMQSLITFCEQSPNNLVPAASYSLLRYIHSGADAIDIADIVAVCKIIVERYPVIPDVDTMWLLAELSSKAECFENLMMCIPAVTNFLQEAISKETEDIAKISAALRIICNMISEPSGQVAQNFLKDFEKSQIFLNKLLSHQYIHIRKETLWLIGNLCNHPIDSISQTVKSVIFSLPSLRLAINAFKEQ